MILKKVWSTGFPYNGPHTPLNGKISITSLVGELNGNRFAIYTMHLPEEKDYFVASGSDPVDPYFHDAKVAAEQKGQPIAHRFSLVGDVDVPNRLVEDALAADKKLDRAAYQSPAYRRAESEFKKKAEKLFAAIH